MCLQTSCRAFADPYVEHDTLTLLLDLILLKRDVYRHLLFNRGLGARKAGEGLASEPTAGSDEAKSERSGGSLDEDQAASERTRTQVRSASTIPANSGKRY